MLVALWTLAWWIWVWKALALRPFVLPPSLSVIWRLFTGTVLFHFIHSLGCWHSLLSRHMATPFIPSFCRSGFPDFFVLSSLCCNLPRDFPAQTTTSHWLCVNGHLSPCSPHRPPPASPCPARHMQIILFCLEYAFLCGWNTFPCPSTIFLHPLKLNINVPCMRMLLGTPEYPSSAAFCVYLCVEPSANSLVCAFISHQGESSWKSGSVSYLSFHPCKLTWIPSSG